MWGCCYGCCYLPAAGASPFLPFFPAVILPAFRRLTFFSLSSSMPSSLLPSLVQTQQDAGSLNRCSSMNDIPGDPPSLPPPPSHPSPTLPLVSIWALALPRARAHLTFGGSSSIIIISTTTSSSNTKGYMSPHPLQWCALLLCMPVFHASHSPSPCQPALFLSSHHHSPFSSFFFLGSSCPLC